MLRAFNINYKIVFVNDFRNFKLKTKFVERNFIKFKYNILNQIGLFLGIWVRIRRSLLRIRRLYIRRSSSIRRVITGSDNLATMLIIIIVKESLKKLTTFSILTLDNNVIIIRIIVQHTDGIIRFMRTDRSSLLGKSKTEMRFIRSLNDIFKKIIFSIFLVFDVLENEVFINIVREKHKF